MCPDDCIEKLFDDKNIEAETPNAVDNATVIKDETYEKPMCAVNWSWSGITYGEDNVTFHVSRVTLLFNESRPIKGNEYFADYILLIISECVAMSMKNSRIGDRMIAISFKCRNIDMTMAPYCTENAHFNGVLFAIGVAHPQYKSHSLFRVAKLE